MKVLCAKIKHLQVAYFIDVAWTKIGGSARATTKPTILVQDEQGLSQPVAHRTTIGPKNATNGQAFDGDIIIRSDLDYCRVAAEVLMR